MRLASKHRGVKTISYTDFTGGLNFSVPPEALRPNECQTLLNWEYEPATGILKTRDGLTKLVDAMGTIQALYYAKNLGLLLVVVDGVLYKLDAGNVLTEIGALAGTKIPIFAEWEEKVLIASGGNLQSTDGLTIATITESPICDYVTVQAGRVVVAREGSDYLYFSGVGDETDWNLTGTADSALQLEVGYKDGGNITSVRMLSKDLVVFKDNRRIYRVVGYYPDWIVYEVSRDAGAVSRLATLEVGNSIVFVDETGIRSLDTVIEYGDVKVRDIGDKINLWVAQNLVPVHVRLWHVRPKGQIWVKIQNDEFVFVYHYALKAWSMFRFSKSIVGITHSADEIYVADEGSIYRLDHNALSDDGIDMEARLILNRKLPYRSFLLKRARVIYQGDGTGTINLTIGRFTKNLGILLSGDVAYFDDDIAYSDDDPVVAINRDERVFTFNHRLHYLQPEIVVVSGKVKLLGLTFVVAEV